MEKLRFESSNLTSTYIEKITEIFPGAVADGKVNFDLLRSMLGDEMTGDEAYEFTWVGKHEAIRETGRPIRKTLRPCMAESKEWDTTENLYIEGDNLDVLKLLQESYLGKVKMIYIDPPYNTGKDFIYRDNFRQTLKDYEDGAGVFDETGDRLFRNTESNARFHSEWCSMIYPRLVMARNMLRNDGVIFISIDDVEVAQLRNMCDEIFGVSNFVGNLIWQSRHSISNDDVISCNHNHTLIFCKNMMQLSFGGDDIDSADYSNPDNDPRGPWKLVPIDANHAGGDTQFPIRNPDNGEEYYPPNGRSWAYNKQTVQDLILDNRIVFGVSGNSAPKRKLFYEERLLRGDVKTPSSIVLDAGTTKSGTEEIMSLLGDKVFDYPKPTTFLERLIKYGCPSDGIVLDFFSGSGTLAQAVWSRNVTDGTARKFILVQYPENLDENYNKVDIDGKKTIERAITFLNNINRPHLLTEIGKERIRRAGEKIKSEAGLLAQNLDIGFRVLKLDDTNMKDVYYAAGDYSQDLLDLMTSNIKEDRTDLDLLYACLLDWGLQLSLPHTHEEINGVTVHTYNKGDLIACFADEISDAVVREIAKRQPLRVVFRDSGFSSSPEKINVEEIFKLLAPNTRVKVL